MYLSWEKITAKGFNLIQKYIKTKNSKKLMRNVS